MGKFTRPTVIPADQYDAIHKSIETKESKDGEEFNIWRWTVTHDGVEVELSATSSMNTGPKSNAGKWASAMLGRWLTDDEIDDELRVLEGRPCRLIVSIDPETRYNVIDAVLPARPATGPATAMSPAPTPTAPAPAIAQEPAAAGAQDDLPF